MPAASGQIPPPWARRENEAPTPHVTVPPPCARCLLRPSDPKHDRELAEWDQHLAEKFPELGPRPEHRPGLCRYCREPKSRKARACRHYPDRIQAALVVKANGVREVREVCEDCESWWGGLRLKDFPDADQLPIWRDKRGIRPPCVRCGDPEAEEHHWAPGELFDDSGAWPTDWLCVKCHHRWHTTMNRPQLARSGPSHRVADRTRAAPSRGCSTAAGRLQASI